MVPQEPLLQQEKKNFEYFMKLPDPPRELIRRVDAKGSQFFEPLIEFSGACSGCGETPYIKLVTQLFGDRALIANATGCSSIFGGNLPTTPYCANHEGRGPAWANSLFEDNAEFGLGFRLAVDKHANQAAALIKGLAPRLGDDLVKALLEGMTKQDEVGIKAQRQRIAELRAMLRAINTPDAALLAALADYLVPKSVWLVGGDGWAYDIGYGGLDHVMAQNHNVNILVLDTEVYSNTGGQASKATPLGAAAKFAASGKTIHKKDLGLIAMSYGHVYVASVALGANDNHTVKVLQEAESYNGTSLVIAYAHCIAHGIHMDEGLDHQKLAVNTGFWPLYRYDPRRMQSNQAPLVLDSTPKADLETFYKSETRFGIMQKLDPNRFKAIIGEAQKLANQRYALYEQLATTTAGPDAAAAPAPTPKN
jgi:pyruvate-ferredoxin/flavodoxin oxidoreductase